MRFRAGDKVTDGNRIGVVGFVYNRFVTFNIGVTFPETNIPSWYNQRGQSEEGVGKLKLLSRWRAELGELYYTIRLTRGKLEVVSLIDCRHTYCDGNYEDGNYYQHETVCNVRLARIKKVLID